MESRLRTVLPVVGILLVIIIALVAFFITRRVSNSSSDQANQNTPSDTSRDLILPSTSASPLASATAKPNTLQTVRTIPRTGIVTNPVSSYQTVITDSGFADAKISVTRGIAVTWKNTGSKPQSLMIEGLSSGPIQPGQQFSYLFDTTNNYTITANPSSTSEVISVQ